LKTPQARGGRLDEFVGAGVKKIRCPVPASLPYEGRPTNAHCPAVDRRDIEVISDGVEEKKKKKKFCFFSRIWSAPQV